MGRIPQVGSSVGLQRSSLQLKAQKVMFFFLCLRLGEMAVVAAPFLCASASFLEKGAMCEFPSLSMMYIKGT